MINASWRTTTLDDAAAIAALVNASSAVAGVHEPMSERRMREQLAGSQWDLASDTRTAEIDGRVVAFGGVSAPPPGGTSARLNGAVDPIARGHGLGAHLMQWLLDRAQALHDASGATQPWLLKHGSNDGDPSTGELLTAFGFTPRRFWFVMDRDLHNVPRPETIDGLELRAVTAGDTQALYEAHRTAFADHWDYFDRGIDRFRSYVVDSDAFVPELSTLAVADAGAVASYVLAFVDSDADPATVSLGLIGTRREWRGRGLAGALVHRTLSAAQDSGLTSATLLVDSDSPTGAVRVYRRLGFEVTSRATTYGIEIGATLG